MTDLHTTLTRDHRTVKWTSKEAKVSIRKEKGMFVVRFHDYFYHKRTRTEYKTIEGAIIAANMIRETYL